MATTSAGKIRYPGIVRTMLARDQTPVDSRDRDPDGPVSPPSEGHRPARRHGSEA